MTKYKKLTRSSFVIVALCLALVGILAFGGTYAYFSAQDSATGTATLGNLAVELNDNAALTLQTNAVVPNQEIFGGNTVSVSYGSTDINFYARVKITAAFEGEITPGLGEPAVTDVLTIGGMSGWAKSGDYYYLGTTEKATKATASTAPTTISPTVTIAKEVGANGSKAYMGKTITVTIVIEVLQADYLASSTEAGADMSASALAAAWNGYVATAKS